MNGDDRDLNQRTDLPAERFRLTKVIVRWKQLSDEGLAAFTGCTNLTSLVLWEAGGISDAGLAYFKGCKDLTELVLVNIDVDDAGLSHFKGCTNLKILNLNSTKATDAGCAYFQDCTRLRELVLRGTVVSDKGLAHFKGCKDLTLLDLESAKPVADLAPIHDLKLKELRIQFTMVSDLRPLEGMELTTILFTPKSITKGLEFVRGMKSLTTIGTEWNQSRPAAEFWERYDKGEFKE